MAKDYTIFWRRVSDRELMLAPHTDLHPYPGHVRIEPQSRAEMEALSREMRSQEEAKMRGMAIQEHLRHLKKWEEQESRLKLKRITGYASRNDQIVCERILASIERRRQNLYKLLFSTEEMLTGCTGIEKSSPKIGLAAYSDSGKRALA